MAAVPGPIQNTPLAELMAFLLFARYASDTPAVTFWTDCQWVHDTFHKGEAYAIDFSRTNSETWAALFKCLRNRTWPVRVGKAKAHVKAKVITSGCYPPLLAEGNTHADAAAKKALELHAVPD